MRLHSITRWDISVSHNGGDKDRAWLMQNGFHPAGNETAWIGIKLFKDVKNDPVLAEVVKDIDKIISLLGEK